MWEILRLFENTASRVLDIIVTRILADALGDLVLVVIILGVATIIMKRNHLDRRRATSNILQVLTGLVGWLGITYYYNQENSPAVADLTTIAVTIVLCIGFCIGVGIAAAVKHFMIAPIAQLRADVAGILMRAAEYVADDAYYEAQKTRVKTIITSINLIEAVINERNGTEVNAEGVG